MSVTVAAFTILALFCIRDYAGLDTRVAFAPALAFYGFSALYLCHRAYGTAAVYRYAASAYLLAAGLCLAWVAPLQGPSLAGPIVVAGMFLTVWIATESHSSRGEPWSRPYYVAVAVMAAVSLLVAVGNAYSWMLTATAVAGVLGLAYYRMVAAVKSVREASSWERVWARTWLYLSAAIGTAALLVPILVRPVGIVETVVCGVAFITLFSVHALKRPGMLFRERSLGTYLAVAWLSVVVAAPISGFDPGGRCQVIVRRRVESGLERFSRRFLCQAVNQLFTDSRPPIPQHVAGIRYIGLCVYSSCSSSTVDCPAGIQFRLQKSMRRGPYDRFCSFW